MHRKVPEAGSLRLLRAAALVSAVAGAAGSVALMIHVGQRKGGSIPAILLVMFTIWVLSPFAALILADLRARRWPVLVRVTLHGVMLIIALGSLAWYAAIAASPPRPKPAAPFLLIPLGSWLVLLTVLPIAAFLSGGSSRRPDGPRSA